MVRAVLQVFFIFPALTWISMSLPAKLASIFNTLHANGAIGKPCTSSSEYDAFLRKFVAWADNIWWFVGAVTLVALYWLYRLAVIEPLLRNHDGLWLRVAFLAISSFMLYAGFYSAVRILVALIFTNWLFHTFTIHVNPLHPDRSAGLGILGHMLTVSGILLIIMGVAGLVMNSSFLFDNDSRFSLVEAVILCTVYLTLAPSLLIGWLTMPHKVMVEARTVVLTDVAKEFQEATEAINSRAVDAETKASTKRLRQLRRRYKLLEETFPTWPLSIQTIRRLAAGVSLPALVPVIGALAGYLGKYLGFHF